MRLLGYFINWTSSSQSDSNLRLRYRSEVLDHPKTLWLIQFYNILWPLFTFAIPAGLEGDADVFFLLGGGELVKIRSSTWKKVRFFKLQEDFKTIWHESHKRFRKNQTCEYQHLLASMCVLHNAKGFNLPGAKNAEKLCWVLEVISSILLTLTFLLGLRLATQSFFL